jgi:hypothetical protein
MLHLVQIVSHLRQTGKIDQCQIQHIWTVYFEMNGQLANSFVLSCYSKRLIFNLSSNLAKVCESFVEMQELGIFGVCRCVNRC